MKNNALLKWTILIPLFLSCTLSHATEDFRGDKLNTQKQRPSFHSRNIDTTHDTSSEEGSPLSNATNSTEEDSLEDLVIEERVYAGSIKNSSMSKKLKRSVSFDNVTKTLSKALNKKFDHKEENSGSKKQTSRPFFQKTKHTDIPTDTGGQNLKPEKRIAFSSPIESPIDNPKDLAPEYPQKRRIQRQRSWGKNPSIITTQPPVEEFKKKADETTPIIPQMNLERVTYNPPIDENVSRKKRNKAKRFSHQRPLQQNRSNTLYRLHPERRDGGLSPRGQLSSRPWEGAPEERNPLQEGLSFYLVKNTQPLDHPQPSPRYQQPSPRYQQPSPRLNHSGRKETTIDLARSSESAETLQGSFLEDQESFDLYPLEQDQPLLAVKYEKDRGNAPFIRIMDNRLYRPDPRVVVGFGVAGSLIFTILPPTAMTGINVNVTGYYFDIPPGEWLSTTLVTTFMTTFTLALLKEGYEWGQTIGWPIWNAMKACYSRCTGTKEQEDVLSAPLFAGSQGAEYTWKIGYKKNLLYWGANGFSLIAALPEGILPTALLSLVWAKYYEHLIIPAGTCLLIRYTGQAYNANTRIVRYLLKGNYSTPV